MLVYLLGEVEHPVLANGALGGDGGEEVPKEVFACAIFLLVLAFLGSEIVVLLPVPLLLMLLMLGPCG